MQARDFLVQLLRQHRHRLAVLFGIGVELELRAGERWFLHGGGTAMMSWPRDRFTYRDHAGEVRPLFEPRLVSGYSLVGFGARL